VLIRSHEPEENKYLNSENIREIIEKDDFLMREYKKTRIVMPSPKFTLIPAPLFDPAKKDEYFTFNHSQVNGNIILSGKISDPDAFIVYSVSTQIHETIQHYFPAVYPLTHIQTLFDNISRSVKSVSGNYIHIHIERDYFNLVIFNDNQLEFCNSYNYRNISDVLYYVMNAFGKLSLKQDETVHLSGITEKYDDLSSGLSMYIRHVKFADPRGSFTFSYVFNDIELHRYLNLFSIFNCG